jgi:hypothetical protein
MRAVWTSFAFPESSARTTRTVIASLRTVGMEDADLKITIDVIANLIAGITTRIARASNVWIASNANSMENVRRIISVLRMDSVPKERIAKITKIVILMTNALIASVDPKTEKMIAIVMKIVKMITIVSTPNVPKRTIATTTKNVRETTSAAKTRDARDSDPASLIKIAILITNTASKNIADEEEISRIAREILIANTMEKDANLDSVKTQRDAQRMVIVTKMRNASRTSAVETIRDAIRMMNVVLVKFARRENAMARSLAITIGNVDPTNDVIMTRNSATRDSNARKTRNAKERMNIVSMDFAERSWINLDAIVMMIAKKITTVEIVSAIRDLLANSTGNVLKTTDALMKNSATEEMSAKKTKIVTQRRENSVKEDSAESQIRDSKKTENAILDLIARNLNSATTPTATRRKAARRIGNVEKENSALRIRDVSSDLIAKKTKIAKEKMNTASTKNAETESTNQDVITITTVITISSATTASAIRRVIVTITGLVIKINSATTRSVISERSAMTTKSAMRKKRFAGRDDADLKTLIDATAMMIAKIITFAESPNADIMMMRSSGTISLLEITKDFGKTNLRIGLTTSGRDLLCLLLLLTEIFVNIGTVSTPLKQELIGFKSSTFLSDFSLFNSLLR